VRNGGTDSDSLLLAAGQVLRSIIPSAGQADPVEELIRGSTGIRELVTEDAELESHVLSAAEIRGERSRVVLLEKADVVRPKRRHSLGCESSEVVPEDVDAPSR
jgi:hypothetical protein